MISSSIKPVPAANHLERLEVQIDSPSISDTDMPCPEGHFPRLKACLHFLTTFITPQRKLAEAGKWINWPVETAFDKDRFTSTSFTRI